MNLIVEAVIARAAVFVVTIQLVLIPQMTVFAQPFLRLSFAIALAACLSIGSLSSWADEQTPSVVVTRNGDAFVVDVTMFALVKHETAWEVLTDFDHMPDFLSNLSYSKTLKRDGSLLLVKQSGIAKYARLPLNQNGKFGWKACITFMHEIYRGQPGAWRVRPAWLKRATAYRFTTMPSLFRIQLWHATLVNHSSVTNLPNSSG